MQSKLSKTIKSGGKFICSSLLDRRPIFDYVGGWLGKRNLGDELLFKAYQELFPSFQFIHYDGGRLANHLHRINLRKRVGLLAGGTLIGQSKLWLDTVNSYSLARNELAVFGTGVADPRFWMDEPPIAQWGPFLRECKYLAVRGPDSSQRLAESGHEGVPFCGDPAIAFAKETPFNNYKPGTLGINIGVSDKRMWGSEEQVCLEAAKLAKLAKAKGWEITWFVVWPKDLPITQEAAQLSGTENDIRLICEDHNTYIDAVKEMSCFVGMKLHATVLATCAQTPSIMLEYQPKCRDFMRSIGQDAFTFRTNQFDAGATWEILAEWNDHRMETAQRLSSSVLKLKTKQAKMAKGFTDLLSKHQR